MKNYKKKSEKKVEEQEQGQKIKNTFNQPIFGSEDFRQYGYCPRKIYFRWIMRKKFNETAKMEKGRKKHKEEQEKQYRKEERKEKKNPEKEIREDYKYRELYLYDEYYGISAKIDLIEVKNTKEGKMEGIITELKHTKGMEKIDPSIELQLGVQSLLIEKHLKIKVTKIRIHSTVDNKELVEEITDGIRTRVLKTLQEMRKIVAEEEIPEPTPEENRCRDCECWKYCLRG